MRCSRSCGRRSSTIRSRTGRGPRVAGCAISAMLIGFVAGGVCYGAVMLKSKLGFDDALDAFGIHGVGGATGALLTGVLARAALNKGAGGGLTLVGYQAIGIAAAAAWSAVV